MVQGEEKKAHRYRDGRARETHGHARPLEEWEVTIPDHHEGYIAWEEFMRNQQQIRSNAGWNARTGECEWRGEKWPRIAYRFFAPASRYSLALQGTYTRGKQHGLLPRYWCAGDQGVTRWFAVALPSRAREIEPLVAIEVLEALRPLGVQAALDALDHTQNQTDAKRRLHWNSLGGKL